MSKIALVGLGLVGRAWAISFARAGHEVALWDERPEAIDETLSFRQQGPARTRRSRPARRRGGAQRSRPHAPRRLARGGARGREPCPGKHARRRRDQARESSPSSTAPPSPKRVLASSTSAILPSLFTEALEGRARCLVAHPINPPYLIPAVEIVPSPWTDADVVERTALLLRAAGHAPIVMKREIDGFVVNRLQGALLEEAFRLVADGFATTEDVDVALREGLALRWSFMGPFETIDLNAPAGVRDYAERYQHIYARIFPSTQWRADWSGPVMDRIEAERRARLPAEKLGERAAWRDRRLMALAAHKRRADKDIGN